MYDGPGASLPVVLAAADLQQLQDLLGSRLTGLLETALGHDATEQLRTGAAALIDLDDVLREQETRQVLLSLLPEHKRQEFYSRTATGPTTGHFNTTMLREAAAFFGRETSRTATRATKAPSTTLQPSYGLFEHQRRAVERVRAHLEHGPVLLHLPTGVGKTRTAMSIVADFLRTHEPAVVVWLASGDELLEQAAAEFDRTWGNLGNRPLALVRCWGSTPISHSGITDGLVVLGLQKAVAGLSADDAALTPLGPRARLVVFDEAHQAIAPTYQQVTDRLTVSPQSRLIGLSATPGRTWSDIEKDRQLSDYFGNNKVTLEIPGHDNPIAALTEQGYLAKPTFTSLLTEPGTEMSHEDLARLAAAVDVPTARLEELATDEQWNLKILDAVRDLATRHRRILVFAASVRHCKILAVLLSATGIPADYVTAESSTEQRRSAINRFTNPYGKGTRALINYGVLTTGFDAPQASAAVIARPTLSLVLYSQMVGRVLRGPRAGGTETCEIVTVVDTALPGFGDIAKAFTNWDDVWRTE